MAEIVRRRSWGGVLPLGRHVSLSGSSFIQCASASIAPPHPGGAKCYPVRRFKVEQALILPGVPAALDVSASSHERRDSRRPAAPVQGSSGRLGRLAAIDDLARGVVNGRLEPVGVGVHSALHLREESSDLVEESNDLFRLVVRHGPISSYSGSITIARSLFSESISKSTMEAVMPLLS